MWSKLLIISAISCPLWSSVYECQRVECALTSPVRTECGMCVMYCMQCCMIVSAVLKCVDVLSRGGIYYMHVCNCDLFSVVNVYLDHLKFCVVCINGRRYVCCSECNVVSNECNEYTPALCNLSIRTMVKLCTLGVFALGVSLVSSIVMISACVC